MVVFDEVLAASFENFLIDYDDVLVPEPLSCLLMGLGMLGIGCYRGKQIS